MHLKLAGWPRPRTEGTGVHAVGQSTVAHRIACCPGPLLPTWMKTEQEAPKSEVMPSQTQKISERGKSGSVLNGNSTGTQLSGSGQKPAHVKVDFTSCHDGVPADSPWQPSNSSSKAKTAPQQSASNPAMIATKPICRITRPSLRRRPNWKRHAEAQPARGIPRLNVTNSSEMSYGCDAQQRRTCTAMTAAASLRSTVRRDRLTVIASRATVIRRKYRRVTIRRWKTGRPRMAFRIRGYPVDSSTPHL